VTLSDTVRWCPWSLDFTPP